VHLKTKGYVYMWDKARRVAGLDRLDTTASITVAAAGPTALPARDAAPAANSRFELASASTTAAGGSVTNEPKVYVLRVKRGGLTARAN
jgi:hypothetical protein